MTTESPKPTDEAKAGALLPPAHGYAANVRIQMTGECWMMCNECGGKLGSFDGCADVSRSCPYQRNGRCAPR
jgi:hypothetical protein